MRSMGAALPMDSTSLNTTNELLLEGTNLRNRFPTMPDLSASLSTTTHYVSREAYLVAWLRPASVH